MGGGAGLTAAGHSRGRGVAWGTPGRSVDVSADRGEKVSGHGGRRAGRSDGWRGRGRRSSRLGGRACAKTPVRSPLRRSGGCGYRRLWSWGHWRGGSRDSGLGGISAVLRAPGADRREATQQRGQGPEGGTRSQHRAPRRGGSRRENARAAAEGPGRRARGWQPQRSWPVASASVP